MNVDQNTHKKTAVDFKINNMNLERESQGEKPYVQPSSYYANGDRKFISSDASFKVNEASILPKHKMIGNKSTKSPPYRGVTNYSN